jgi:hypothetical protein
MEANRRKDERLGLAIPVRVQGYLAGGATWEELSNTIDVSQRGACFLLKHPLELGHVLRLTLAMPKRLRNFDETESAYRVFSLVRFVERRGAQARIGVLFFGQYPPRGFQEHPDGRYLLPGDPIHRTPAAVSAAAPQAPPRWATPQPPAAAAAAGSVDPSGPAGTPPAPVPVASVPEFVPSGDVERRGAPRVEVFVNFLLQLTDTQGSVVQQELTVADNIGRGGARVMTALTFQVGDVVLLQEAGGAFSTRAEVRAVTRVQPTYERLHLRFMDREAPDRLLH